ncbi:MAG: PSD1 and planctomycete cytochrome C domain-containing protein [Verrucomicrobiaceae bacterium]
MKLRNLAWLLAHLLALAVESRAESVRYNRDIRPILSDNCFACHGPDKANQKGGLRLDVREQAMKPAKSGDVAIVPGDTGKSALIIRIESGDEDEMMPPVKSHKTLTKEQKAKLKQWITEGANYEKHWAFIPPVAAKLPEVKLAGWPRNDIDRFVLSRLEAEGLSPSAEATKEALIRRVTLDLTGLPPTLAEVDAFVSDASPQAFEKVVERLLRSPRYGERMAVDWLDAARYADSNGYQVDRDRELWPWRDWVIRAFNDNKRFDQFTIEQLAGDLLPGASLEQKIATGFHRNHMLNEEGGVLADEFLAEYTADRVETTAAVWLGQTFNCARCHDHKYDPFTQRDFYSMKAFFHNIPEKGVGIYSNPIRINAPPFVKLPAPEIEARITALHAKVKAVNDRLAALTGKSAAGVDAWAGRVASASVRWEPVKLSAASGGDQPPHLDTSTNTLDVGPQETRQNNIKITASVPKGRVTALRFECGTTASAASFQWSELTVGKLKLRAATLGDSLTAAEAEKVLDRDRKTKAVLSITPARPVSAVFEVEPGAMTEDLIITIGVENAGGPSRWRVFAADVEKDLLVPANVIAAAKKDTARRTAAERRLLADFRSSQQPEHRMLKDELAALNKQIAAAEGEIPTTLVMEEMKEPRQTFILMRGAYDKPGELVTAATPAVLPALDKDLPHNRLGLARWLISPGNPLTARVTVNRFWQQVFGSGLVKTSEDFGAQGAQPSHPELLDWLALEFIRSGWDVKHLMKLMVTSATYRQSSQFTVRASQTDPENRLLWRGPHFRLMGEFIRDQALAAGDLLVEKIGGPSVKPYHPPGIYEQVTAGNGYNVYVPGKGDDLHRRSLYTYWKRSVPHPAMLLFDAPFRETCTLRRPRTNTPLQALNLLNDPTYVEAARFLGQRMMRDGGSSLDSRLIHGFRLLLSRQPKPQELMVLRTAWERARKGFQTDPEAAKSLLAVGDARSDVPFDSTELAAFTLVASTLFNLDEAVTKP